MTFPRKRDEELLRDGSSASRADQLAEASLGRRSLVFSLGLHVGLVVAIFVAGFVSFRPKKSPLDELAEFTVAVPPEPPPEEPPPDEKPPPEPLPEPDPAPVADPEPDPDPLPVPATTRPKPTRHTIDTRNAKIVRRTQPPATRRIVPAPTIPPRTIQVRTAPTFSGPRLSPQELQRLLDLGATPSDHTSIPAGEQERCYALIRKQLNAAWIKPSAAAITPTPPVVRIAIGPDGSVRSASLQKSSGNAELDRSAVSAANAVRRFTGLSAAFIGENPDFTVAFQLEGN